MATRKKAPTPSAKLAWKTSEPHRSATASLTGDPRHYRVHTLVVADPSLEAAMTAIGETMRRIAQLAPSNLDQQHDVILFQWDGVYSQLAVTFTRRRRPTEGEDVLKVLFAGWDKEIQEAEDYLASQLEELRLQSVVDLLREAADALRPQVDAWGATMMLSTDPTSKRRKKL